jgi:N-ethylmaleimide reductase
METNTTTGESEGLKLFAPFKLGRLELAHRVVHAPTTRLRANPDDGVSDMMVEYYSQRASKDALIIIEGSLQVSAWQNSPS